MDVSLLALVADGSVLLWYWSSFALSSANPDTRSQFHSCMDSIHSAKDSNLFRSSLDLSTSGMTTETILHDIRGRPTSGSTYSPTKTKDYQSFPFIFRGQTYRRIAAGPRFLPWQQLQSCLNIVLHLGWDPRSCPASIDGRPGGPLFSLPLEWLRWQYDDTASGIFRLDDSLSSLWQLYCFILFSCSTRCALQHQQLWVRVQEERLERFDLILLGDDVSRTAESSLVWLPCFFRLVIHVHCASAQPSS